MIEINFYILNRKVVLQSFLLRYYEQSHRSFLESKHYFHSYRQLNYYVFLSILRTTFRSQQYLFISLQVLIQLKLQSLFQQNFSCDCNLFGYFTISTAANIVAAINNCIVGSYFTFTINNKAGAANDRTIVAGTGITITNLISPIIPGGSSLVFICRITNIGSGTEAAELYDTVA